MNNRVHQPYSFPADSGNRTVLFSHMRIKEQFSLEDGGRALTQLISGWARQGCALTYMVWLMACPAPGQVLGSASLEIHHPE